MNSEILMNQADKGPLITSQYNLSSNQNKTQNEPNFVTLGKISEQERSLETPPNIYDTRSSFLLKVEKNREMRENFLKAYNRREGAN